MQDAPHVGGSGEKGGAFGVNEPHWGAAVPENQKHGVCLLGPPQPTAASFALPREIRAALGCGGPKGQEMEGILLYWNPENPSGIARMPLSRKRGLRLFLVFDHREPRFFLPKCPKPGTLLWQSSLLVKNEPQLQKDLLASLFPFLFRGQFLDLLPIVVLRYFSRDHLFPRPLGPSLPH